MKIVVVELFVEPWQMGVVCATFPMAQQQQIAKVDEDYFVYRVCANSMKDKQQLVYARHLNLDPSASLMKVDIYIHYVHKYL